MSYDPDTRIYRNSPYTNGIRNSNLILTDFPFDEIPPETEAIEITGHKIASLPEKISNLQNLEYLILRNNDFSDLPESLCELSKLIQIDLQHNYFRGIPDVLGKLPNLEHLDMGHNLINGMRVSPGSYPKLRGLRLSYNQLDAFPAEVGYMPNLEDLRLNANSISDGPEKLTGFSHLGILDMSDNRLEHFPHWLAKLPSLTELILSHNPLADPIGRIEGFRELRWLRLHACGLRNFPDILNLPELEVLTLTSNSLCTVPVRFHERLNALAGLHLQGNRLQMPIGKLKMDIQSLLGNGSLRVAQKTRIGTLPEHRTIETHRRDVWAGEVRVLTLSTDNQLRPKRKLWSNRR